MTFLEEWFGPDSQTYLGELAVSVTDVEGLIVEIGCWQGRSTVALANAVAPRTVHAVDTWQGSPGEVSAALAASRDVFAEFQANVAELTAGNVEIHRMGWRDFLPTVSEPVAFAFIDAEHSYREVYDNVAALIPMMASGGVLCGDDMHHPPVRRALLDLLPADEVWACTTVWSWRKP